MSTDPDPTPDIIRAVAAAISRAEIHDDRMTSDPNRIRVWAESCTKHGIDDTALACRAVDAHYETRDPDTLRVGTFIAHYRRIRALDAEYDKGQQLTAGELPAAPDTQTGHYQLPDATGKPIWAAYEHYDAVTVPCPTCHAKPEESCTNTTNNRSRKIPCLARMTAAIRHHRETP